MPYPSSNLSWRTQGAAHTARQLTPPFVGCTSWPLMVRKHVLVRGRSAACSLHKIHLGRKAFVLQKIDSFDLLDSSRLGGSISPPYVLHRRTRRQNRRSWMWSKLSLPCHHGPPLFLPITVIDTLAQRTSSLSAFAETNLIISIRVSRTDLQERLLCCNATYQATC